MPIIVSEAACNDRLRTNLEAERVPVITQGDALRRDIRPARIGLLNLMPAASMEKTEIQWLRRIADTALQIEPVLVKFDHDEREKGKRADVLCDYTNFSYVAHQGLDGLIVTGDNLEVKPHQGLASREPIDFDEIKYAKKLNRVLDWARKNVPSTIYSCLGAHYALHHFHGLPREITPRKTFGIYDHEVLDPSNPFVSGMNSKIISPHSRWGNVDPERMRGVASLSLLAVSQEVGWLLASDQNEAGGHDLFIQGHPEYYRSDLDDEYQRDAENGQAVPENYYVDDNPDNPIRHTWVTDARALHANYINMLYERFSKPEITS